MCKWWNSFGNTWWAERMGQRPNKGDHLLDIPCVGDTGASWPVWLSVGAGRECRVSLRSSIWSWSMDLLRLYFVVSQLLTKTNLVWQCKAMLGIPWYTTFKIAFKFKSSLGRFILCWHFWGRSRRRWGTSMNATKKNRLTVSTCQCTTCICCTPMKEPIHFVSTAWPQKTGGRTWWNQRTNLWRSTIHQLGQWCRKNWEI